ncbi:MAG: hypothetical protein Q8S33_27260 [Myxococcales bacterium]|nr:hypothetical protein [Myxococcales bacterium]
MGDALHHEVPTVDPQTGEVWLYRNPGPGGEASASLVHELVHALRWPLWRNAAFQTSTQLFVEEALAELVATEAGFPSAGFPTWGVSRTVAAGSWVSANEDLPIERLIREHVPLNFQCMAQAYVLRLSFMGAMQKRVGLAALVKTATGDTGLTPEQLELALGGSLPHLGAEWRSQLLADFAATPGAQEQANRYRNETPIQYLPRCAADGTPLWPVPETDTR